MEGFRITRSQFRRMVEFDRATSNVPEMLRKAGITPESVLATLPQVRKELYQEWYGSPRPAKHSDRSKTTKRG